MKLFLTSAYQGHSRLDRMLQLQKQDVHGHHELANSPVEADVIVFIENTQFTDILFKKLLNHPLVKAHPEKVYMFNEMDRSWPMLPGLYCSLSAKFAAYSDHAAFPYINICNDDIQNIHKDVTERRWLYSFVGSSSHSVRKPVLKLNDERALVVDTSEFCVWNHAQTSKYDFQKTYINSVAGSKFVLCPRGIGPSSLRLYETLEAGRVPVIISDEWVAPKHIDWNFAVRIPEWEISAIPTRLRELENEWEDRSTAARAAWESAYAPNQMFNTFATSLENISRSANLPIHSLRISSHKWRVFFEQHVRNLLKPPAGIDNPANAADLKNLSNSSKISRKISRKV
ncbi:glycosyltransferase family 47 protein [Granulosicoccus sp.]|nr:exostosin family protein [Granulosicoccus sp.]MDB4223118.1 glycosyltransferase family 47 protein [Granulosicoccus sp.]